MLKIKLAASLLFVLSICSNGLASNCHYYQSNKTVLQYNEKQSKEQW